MAKAKNDESGALTQTLNERIKELSNLSVDSVNYLGKSEKTGEGLRIYDAIEVAGRDLENALKHWIRQDNIESLEEFTIEGEYSLAVKKFNRDQLFLIDVVASNAAYKMSKVVKDLENESF